MPNVKIIIIIINHIYIAPTQNTSFYGALHKTKLYINLLDMHQWGKYANT